MVESVVEHELFCVRAIHEKSSSWITRTHKSSVVLHH